VRSTSGARRRAASNRGSTISRGSACRSFPAFLSPVQAPPEASFHRQWARLLDFPIAGLSNFYRDNTGESIGVGDISHVVGG
jgi:hypothetical protein